MDKIKNQIKTINGGEPIKYKRDFMKIEFESDDALPLDKILNNLDMAMVVGSVLQEGNKYYAQVYLHECAYEICEWIIKSAQSYYNIHNISHIFHDKYKN